MWKKRDDCSNVRSVVERNTKMVPEDFLNPKKNPHLDKLEETVAFIKLKIEEKVPITIIGDYDVDGVSSSAILFLMFKELGIIPKVIIPRRFSDGYGVSKGLVDKIDSGLLITVDNGIAAVDAIEYAKTKGLSVVIIDHHLPPEGELPDADIILDPHVNEEKSEFCDYCGAGLSFRLACELIDNRELLKKLLSLAAIGTIADVMPLIGDNRRIVKSGLKQINDGNVTAGLAALLKQGGFDYIDETSVGFFLAPILNAAGRLKDSGSTRSFQLLASESNDINKLREWANAFISLNNNRKGLVSAAIDKIEEKMKVNGIAIDKSICLYDSDFQEGIIGIVAGKLAEQHKCPCVIFTDGPDNTLKGSARSCGEVNIKSLLDNISNTMVAYGGHAGAAGLTVDKDRYLEFKSAFESECRKCDCSNNESSETNYYDLDVKEEQVDSVFSELQKYAPFGEGNDRIIVKISKFKPTPNKYGDRIRFFGTENQHVRIFGRYNTVVAFNLADKFETLENTNCFDLYATISLNVYKGKESIQLTAEDIEDC